VIESAGTQVETPRVEERNGLIVAGLRGRYNMKTVHQIREQWKMFVPYMEKIRGRVGASAYGVVAKMIGPDKFDYVSGVEVANREGVPVPLYSLPIVTHQYLIFPYRDHVSKMKDAVTTIWREWLPASRYKVAFGPNLPGMIEFYGADFNPGTGMGTMELWIPIQ
jgi:AraC family transcriptional regulator